MYTTTTDRLLSVLRQARQDPTIKVKTGMWNDPEWTVAELRRWFLRCLNDKINRSVRQVGRKYSDQYQTDLWCDARTINDYFVRRIRQSGSRNILRTPEMRRRYPQVNCQPAYA